MERRRARVLIVDDDAKFGNLMARALTPEHDVVALASAGEALARIEAGERFDLLLCDLMMPAVTGADFHERLSVIAPELVERMVVVTGGAFTARTEAFLERVDIPLLEKPFALDELRWLVRAQRRRSDEF